MDEQTITTEESQEATQNSGEIVLTDPITGKFAKGHPKVGGKALGSVSLVSLMKKRLQQAGPDGRRTMAEHFIGNILQEAMEFDSQSRKLVLNYIEGMPLQKTEMDIGFKPTPLLNALRNNPSSPQDSNPESEN